MRHQAPDLIPDQFKLRKDNFQLLGPSSARRTHSALGFYAACPPLKFGPDHAQNTSQTPCAAVLEAKRPKASESADLVGDADPAQVSLLRPGSALVTSITPKSQHRPSPVYLRSRLRAGLQDFPNTLPTISFADQKQVHGIDFNIPSKLDFSGGGLPAQASGNACVWDLDPSLHW